MKNVYNSSKEDNDCIIKAIKKRMDDTGITQYRLSKVTGIPESTLSRNFKGLCKMSVTSLLTICTVLDLKVHLTHSSLDDKEING